MTDKEQKEEFMYLKKLLDLVPKDLKAGESFETICPDCGNKLIISKSDINGHLWIVCEKEGTLLCE